MSKSGNFSSTSGKNTSPFTPVAAEKAKAEKKAAKGKKDAE